MSTLLYRIGRAAYGRPWYFIGAWLVVLGVIVGILVASPPKLSTEIRIDGTPSQSVIDNLAQRLPAAAGGQGIIAFEAPTGERIDTGANLTALTKAIDAVYGAPHVVNAPEEFAAQVASGQATALLQAAAAIAKADAALPPPARAQPTPLLVGGQQVPGVAISPNGQVALFQFEFDKQTYELPASAISHTVNVSEQAVSAQGIRVLPSSAMIAAPALVGPGEIIGLIVAALVLLITLGSVVAAGLPLGTALMGIAVGVGGAFTFSHLVTMQSLTAMLALMVGLAVGIDYSLFIVNRQRRLILDQKLLAHEATGRALGTSGSAVVFAGTTVIIALLALMVVRVQMLTTMAVVAAVTVAIAVIAANTLLPALLGLIGERICSAKTRLKAEQNSVVGGAHRVAHAWSTFLTRHRVLSVVAAVIIAGAVAIPMATMDLGLPAGSSYNKGTPQRASYDVIDSAFGEGYNGPLVVAADSPDGKGISTQNLVNLDRDLSGLPGVAAVQLAGLSPDAATAIFSVTPATGPTDPKTTDLIHVVRDRAAGFEGVQGVTVGVTGFTALAVDISARLAQVLPLYLAVVIGLSLIVLLLVFRSIVVPLKATVGFLLTVFATFGATTAVFQWGWVQGILGLNATSPVLSLLPIVVTGVLYGLAMDYEVFLVSSMKEAHVHGHRGRESVVFGFSLASRVVVAAAIIMTSVFAGFAFNEDPMIKQFGFALAFGILIDAFVVRMTFVPAIMALFGDKAWWLPRWLDRILPNFDIEGDALVRSIAAQQVRENAA